MKLITAFCGSGSCGRLFVFAGTGKKLQIEDNTLKKPIWLAKNTSIIHIVD
jgi:hypothetical protein